MDTKQRQILKENYFHLEKNIDYNKLIQYLEESKMFNRYMWNDIHSISDVLELLPTRGPEAFHNFIKILRDGGYVAEADLLEKPCLSMESSVNLYYKMSSIPLGYCLIINNMKFNDPVSFEYRKGSDIDANSLEDFFKKADFEVEVVKDLSAYKMSKCLVDFSRKDFTLVDSMIIIIMSHGAHSSDNKEILYGTDGEFLYKEDIYEMFSNKSCKALQSKPKVFFFVACRGKNQDYGVQKWQPKESESLDSKSIGISDTESKILPQISDMYVINSTLPYHVTVRDHGKGTYFCQALVPVLNKYYKIHDLETMIKFVNQELDGKVSKVFRINVQTVHFEGIVWRKKIMLHRKN